MEIVRKKIKSFEKNLRCLGSRERKKKGGGEGRRGEKKKNGDTKFSIYDESIYEVR